MNIPLLCLLTRPTDFLKETKFLFMPFNFLPLILSLFFFVIFHLVIVCFQLHLPFGLWSKSPSQLALSLCLIFAFCFPKLWLVHPCVLEARLILRGLELPPASSVLWVDDLPRPGRFTSVFTQPCFKTSFMSPTTTTTLNFFSAFLRTSSNRFLCRISLIIF